MNRRKKIFIFLACVFGSLFFIFNFCKAATLYLEPQSAEYYLNDSFVENIRVDNNGDNLNAFEVYLKYPSNLLEVVDINFSNSILSQIIEKPEIDKTLGTIFFSGIVPGGYNGRIIGDPGSSNLLASIIFKVSPESLSANQQFKINFQDNSLVLLNDGIGTKATLATKSAEIKIINQVTATPSVFSLADDKIPPESFTPEITRQENVFNNQWFLIFSTQDKISDINYYEVQESFSRNPSKDKWFRTESPYLIKDQALRSYIFVKAVDHAGNERIETISPQISLLRILSYENYLIFGIIVIIIIVGLWRLMIWRKRIKK